MRCEQKYSGRGTRAFGTTSWRMRPGRLPMPIHCGKCRPCRCYCTIRGGDIERLLNHLVGAPDQCVWNVELERLGGLQIYVQCDFSGPLDRQVAGLVALENAPSIISGQAVCVADVGS